MPAIHNEVDNKTALSYLLKMRGAKNLELIQISKEVWEFLLVQGITITAEHLPGNLNSKADWESRHQKDSSEWKLCLLIFRKICQILGEKNRNRPAYFKVANSASKLLLWEAGSQQFWHRCSSTEMVLQESICIFSICLDSQSTERGRGRESTFSYNTNSKLADLKLLPRTLKSFSVLTIQSFCH